MKIIFSILVSLMLYASSIASATSIPWEHITGYNLSGNPSYGWNYSYDICLLDDVLIIDVDLKLIGHNPGQERINAWETSIETTWSTDRFDTPIVFNVNWVSSDQDYTVTITDTTNNNRMTRWAAYSHINMASHEFGHMLGLFDEYSGGAYAPIDPLFHTGGLMEKIYFPTLDHYYTPFLEWKNEKLDSMPTHAPEPSTFILLASGLAMFIRRRK